MIKSDGSLPEGGSAGEDILRLLRAARKAEKEDSIELPQGSKTQTADGPPSQGLLTSSS